MKYKMPMFTPNGITVLHYSGQSQDKTSVLTSEEAEKVVIKAAAAVFVTTGKNKRCL